MEKIIRNIEQTYGINCKILKEFNAGNYGKTFEVSVGNEPHVLKIIPSCDEFRLKKILPLLTFINKRQVHVPSPLSDKKGALYNKQLYNDENVLVYLYPLLEGENAEDCLDDFIEQGKLKLLGKTIANLHNIMNDLPTDNRKDIQSWSDSEGLFVIYEDEDPSIPEKIKQIYQENIEKISGAKLDNNHIIHSDLHLANVLHQADTDQFKFIDFENCVLGSRVMDLAVLLFDLPIVSDTMEKAVKGIKDLIHGYVSITPLDKEEIFSIPVYLKILECASYINFYKYRLNDDPWLNNFYQGREEAILGGNSYLNIDLFDIK